MSNVPEQGANGLHLVERFVGRFPASSGFYWWRESDLRSWRIVKVYEVEDNRRFADDVMHHDWTGRSFDSWFDGGFPMGEWVKILSPNAKVSNAEYLNN